MLIVYVSIGVVISVLRVFLKPLGYVAKVANLLHIKGMLKGGNDSKIGLAKKIHGRKVTLKTLVDTCLEKVVDKDQVVYISRCNCVEDANAVKDGLVAGGVKNVEVYPYHLVTGAHVGPGCVALFYIGEYRDSSQSKILRNHRGFFASTTC